MSTEVRSHALADVIERRMEDIVHRWMEQVRTDAIAAHVSPTDLRDGIHEYLMRLARVLREHDPHDALGVAAWTDVAQQHVSNRVRLEFDVAQLFRELVILRGITTAVLREEGYLAAGEEVQQLIAVIDGAIEASIKCYVDARDEMTRRAEAERIGFLTHELRNPLGVVSLVLAQLKHPALSESNTRRGLEVLERSLERMRRLIDATLLTKHLQSGKVQTHPVDITVGRLTEDAIPLFQQHARDKGVGFIATFDPQAIIRTDPHLTMSALQNLLDNAIKYTESGDVQLRIEVRPADVAIHVYDSGRGLTAEDMAVIFEPFRRIDRANAGAGLGLAIARSAIEAQGGSIHAESVPGHGSHFWFRLPQERK